jgi:hypothetical protein
MIDKWVLLGAGKQWWLQDMPEPVNDSTLIHGRLFDSNANLQWCLEVHHSTKTSLPTDLMAQHTFRQVHCL